MERFFQKLNEFTDCFALKRLFRTFSIIDPIGLFGGRQKNNIESIRLRLNGKRTLIKRKTNPI